MDTAGKKIAVIAGNFIFPDGNAAGKRVAGLGLILRDLGYMPVFIGVGKAVCDGAVKAATAGSGLGMHSYSIPYPESTVDWMNYPRQVKRTIKIIKGIGEEKIALLLLYGSPAISLWMWEMMKYAKNRGVRVIADCVDWIQFSGRGFLKNIVKFLDTNLQKRLLIPHADGIITVSRFLHGFYMKSGCNAIMVPPVFDTEELARSYPRREAGSARRKRLFCYAGVPFDATGKKSKGGLKDRIDRTVDIFADIWKTERNFRFDVFGVTEQEYLSVFPEQRAKIQALNGCAIFHGRADNADVLRAIAGSDFTILQRDDTLITRAGFPTKVSESISLGIPVIADRTSNIDEFIEDGVNGFLLDGVRDTQTMMHIMSLSDGDIEKMKENCMKNRIFDYRLYLGLVENMLSGIKVMGA